MHVLFYPVKRIQSSTVTGKKIDEEEDEEGEEEEEESKPISLTDVTLYNSSDYTDTAN